MKSSYFTIFTFALLGFLQAQTVSVRPMESEISVEKWKGMELVIPITLETRNFTNKPYRGKLSIVPNTVDLKGTTKDFLNNELFEKIIIPDNEQIISIDTGYFGVSLGVSAVTLLLDSNMEVTQRTTLPFLIQLERKTVGAFTLVILPPYRNWFSFSMYKSSPPLRLHKVSNVSNEGNRFVIKGYHKRNMNSMVQRNLQMEGNLYSFYHSDPAQFFTFAFSFVYAPIRFRGPSESLNLPARTFVNQQSILMNFEFISGKTMRFYDDGSKSESKLAFGLLVGPSVNPILPEDGVKGVDELGVLFYTLGVSLSFSRNNIYIYGIPFAFDVTADSRGNTAAIYKRPWSGFGIGFSPEIFRRN